MKVLLVEDSKTIQLILRSLLEQLGIVDVDTASDGEEGLRKLEAEQFDLVLLDLHLPVIDGFGVLESMKEKGIEALVIVVSSDSDYRQIMKTKELGAFGYITKPFNRQALESAVRVAEREAN